MNAETAVQDLCAAIGVGPRTLPVVLRFERSGEIRMESREDGLVVYLARQVPEFREGVAAAALRSVHPDRGLPFRVKAAFRGADTLVFLTRIPDDRVDLPTLDAAMRLLARLAEEAEEAGGI